MHAAHGRSQASCVLRRAAKEQQKEDEEEKRQAAAFDCAMQARSQVKAFRRVQLGGSAQPAAGLPVEVWAIILGLLIDNKLWDLLFVRDICNAGRHSAAAASWAKHACVAHLVVPTRRHDVQVAGTGSWHDLPASCQTAARSWRCALRILPRSPASLLVRLWTPPAAARHSGHRPLPPQGALRCCCLNSATLGFRVGSSSVVMSLHHEYAGLQVPELRSACKTLGISSAGLRPASMLM